jgi:hypothetical protein
VTSGEPKGTNGWSRFDWRPWAALVLLGSTVAFVNATSEIMEAGRDGRDLHPAAPFLWEFSSAVVMLCLAPFIGEAVRRWPPRREGIVLRCGIHLALTLPYSALHVAGMVGLRKLGYAAVGSFYEFSYGHVLREFFYEWRKDVVGYAVIAAVYWYFQNRVGAAAAPTDPRIEIRDGGRTFFVPPAEIMLVEAAGNYVEIHTADKTHLVRGSLATYEARLAAHGFVRVHRSRLVNRARIRAWKPTASGDLELTLDDGRAVAASRRYREALETRPA